MVWPTKKPPGGFVEKPASGIPARGAGWGGAAQGEGKAWTKDDYPSNAAKAGGRAAAQTAREVAKAHAVAMAELMLQIANDPAAPMPTRLDAANKLIERAEGKAIAAVDMTSKGERMGYVIPAPPEAEDATAWATQHKPN